MGWLHVLRTVLLQVLLPMETCGPMWPTTSLSQHQFPTFTVTGSEKQSFGSSIGPLEALRCDHLKLIFMGLEKKFLGFEITVHGYCMNEDKSQKQASQLLVFHQT